MKLTDWYPKHIKPVRVGMYETRFFVIDWCNGYSYWTGTKWACSYHELETAYTNRTWMPDEARQDKQWRGLTKGTP